MKLEKKRHSQQLSVPLSMVLKYSNMLSLVFLLSAAAASSYRVLRRMYTRSLEYLGQH